MSPRARFLALAALAACSAEAPAPAPDRTQRALAAPFARIEGSPEAAFASAETAAIMNYSRAAPNVAIAGALGAEGIAAAKNAGFSLLIDLRRPEEHGVAEDILHARKAGIDRVSLPMPNNMTAMPAFLDALSAMLEDEARYPVLLHCASANRAGAAWALYRISDGVPALAAIEEGRAAGMTSKENMVRRFVRLPPLKDEDR